MNYTETFEQFSSRVTTLDLALYAGIAMVIWVLFKDKFVPLQNKLTTYLSGLKQTTAEVVKFKEVKSGLNDDAFVDLILSWKKTRDLAESQKCDEAVKVADEMFPFLSPNACSKDVK